MPGAPLHVIFIAFACVVASPAWIAAATLREARISVAFLPGRCDVTARFVVDTAEPAWIDHRLLLDDNVNPPFAVTGAVASTGEVVGRTVRLPVSLVGTGRNEYQVHYRSAIAQPQTDRCPLLVPDAPSDGGTRGVELLVTLPPDVVLLPGSFPALAWDDRTGRVSLGHVPSFVRAPHAARGTPLGWRDTLDVQRYVDVAAIVVIAAATLAWAAVRKARG
jgi:hypothetical protein